MSVINIAFNDFYIASSEFVNFLQRETEEYQKTVTELIDKQLSIDAAITLLDNLHVDLKTTSELTKSCFQMVIHEEYSTENNNLLKEQFNAIRDARHNYNKKIDSFISSIRYTLKTFFVSTSTMTSSAGTKMMYLKAFSNEFEKFAANYRSKLFFFEKLFTIETMKFLKGGATMSAETEPEEKKEAFKSLEVMMEVNPDTGVIRRSEKSNQLFEELRQKAMRAPQELENSFEAEMSIGMIETHDDQLIEKISSVIAMVYNDRNRLLSIRDAAVISIALTEDHLNYN